MGILYIKTIWYLKCPSHIGTDRNIHSVYDKTKEEYCDEEKQWCSSQKTE